MKILGCTSIRSDYDLLSPLYRLLQDDSSIDFKLIVSGAHLSEFYGKTIAQIEKDGFDVLVKIETIKSKIDNKASRLKSASELLKGIIDVVDSYRPDLIIYSGDREDVIVYSMVGGYLGIPTIHFYSGDHTKDGYIDNPIRHAASKLSSAHFVSIEEHAKRLIAMGESKERIFQIGSIALDRFCHFKSLPLEIVREKLTEDDKEIKDNYCLVIFHPLGEEIEDSTKKFKYILKSLDELKIQGIVSYPNTDPNNLKIRQAISEYKDNSNFIFYENLERDLFLSIYKNAQFIIGNSSSGIHEAASIPIPAINVGQRQKGRFAGENVIFIDGDSEDEVRAAVVSIQEESFAKNVKNMKNPYGDESSAEKAYELIKNTDFSKLLLKTEDALEVSDE